jgi:hypothetical protein
MTKLHEALTLLDRLERGEFVQPSEAESLLVQVFESCGYPVTEKGFVGSGNALLEVDCFIRTTVNGTMQTIAAEAKAGPRPAGIESVQQAFNLKANGHFDRAMIVSRLGFSPYSNVVGDLNKVVDLGSLSNNRIANPAPIDRRSSSNLDIIFNCNNAKLRHLEMPGCLHDETKPVLADVTTRMNDDAIANDRIRYRTPWTDRTILSNPNVWPNHAVGADQRSSADSSPRSYDRTGIDRRTSRKLSGAMDRCARRDAVCFEKRRGTQCVRMKFASH